MSEMVLRLARAAAKVDGCDDPDDANYTPDTRYIERARLAIETMRIPTGPMVEAIASAVLDRATPSEIWAAAIDEALK